jgi:3-oxoacyl-[acyl-carrier-protein] synthase II
MDFENMENQELFSGVAITGLGVVSSIGTGYEAFCEAALKYRSGIGLGSQFYYTDQKGVFAGKVINFDAGLYLPRKGISYMDRSSLFLCSAASLAIKDANLVITDENKDRIGVICCSSFGCLKSISNYDLESLTGKTPLSVSPMDFPNTAMNSATANISILNGPMGYNTTMLGGFTSTLEAISHGICLLKLNKLDAVLVGSVEDLSEQLYIFYKSLGILSDSNELKNCITPFDKRGSGTVLGEGAVVFVLEKSDIARRANRKIRANIKGIAQAFTGRSNYSYFDAPSASDYASVMKLALRNSSLEPGDIDLISASANGCLSYDTTEANAILSVFQHDIPPITSIKAMIGETASASAAFSIALAIAATEYQKAPHILNLNEPIVPLNYILSNPRDLTIKHSMITSMDPNGNCMGIIISEGEQD